MNQTRTVFAWMPTSATPTQQETLWRILAQHGPIAMELATTLIEQPKQTRAKSGPKSAIGPDQYDDVLSRCFVEELFVLKQTQDRALAASILDRVTVPGPLRTKYLGEKYKLDSRIRAEDKRIVIDGFLARIHELIGGPLTMPGKTDADVVDWLLSEIR